jgi:predicted hotdog family 3-hydroxylacyl-ACP dehydratase
MIFGKSQIDMEPVTGDALIALIPQKPPFVLISKLLQVDNKRCITSFTCTADHVLCDKGKLTVAGLIENIAQTCAAKVGYEYSLKGKKYPIGFIGDLKDFTCSVLPAAGEEMKTNIEIEHEIFDVTVIKGVVLLNDKEIAHCKMKVYSQGEKG